MSNASSIASAYIEENGYHKTLKTLNHKNSNDCVTAILFNVIIHSA